MLGPERKIPASSFYWNYHGQRIEDLHALISSLKGQGCGSFVWLAGDSSLDNKHWLFNGEKDDPVMLYHDEVAAPALNGYENVLAPQRMMRDVCYWVNKELHEARRIKGTEMPLTCAVNTAIEESTLGERVGNDGALLPQDEFLRDHLTEQDVLIVDVGGNDIALRPTAWTGINMAALLYLSCTPIIRRCSFVWAPCSGWYFGFPLGLGYFVNMFRHRATEYIEKLVAKRKPKKVIVCMLYYLDEAPSGGWADNVLKILGYDRNPAKLQAVIKRVFELATSKIKLEGTEVVPFPLFVPLNGKDPGDYVQRVEPSAEGGRKMAEALVPVILQ